MMKRKIESNKAIFVNECWSMWEGCCCNKKKNHPGDHVCAAECCDCTWTTEQGDEWIATLNKT